MMALLDEQAEARKAKALPVPYDDIVAAYHEKLPMLARVRAFGPKSKIREHLKARWDEDDSRHDVGWWRAYFGDVAEMPWLTGDEPGKDGRDPFKACLAWLVLPTNMDKVLNGHYRKRAKAPPPEPEMVLCYECGQYNGKHLQVCSKATPQVFEDDPMWDFSKPRPRRTA